MATVDPDYWKRRQAEQKARQEQRAMTQRGMADYRKIMKVAHGHTRGRAAAAGAGLLTGTGPGEIAASKGADAKGAQEHRHAVAAQAAKDNAKGRPAGRIGGAPGGGRGGRSPMGGASLASHGPRGGRPRASLLDKRTSLAGRGSSILGKSASLVGHGSSLLGKSASLKDHRKGLHDFRSADRYGRDGDGRALNREERERIEQLKAAGREIMAKGPPDKEDAETLGRIRDELEGAEGAGRRRDGERGGSAGSGGFSGGFDAGFDAGLKRGEEGAKRTRMEQGAEGREEGDSMKMRSASAGGEEDEEDEQGGAHVRMTEVEADLDASGRLQEQLDRVMRGEQDGGSMKMRSAVQGGEEDEEDEQPGSSVRVKEEKAEMDASDRLQEQLDRVMRGEQEGDSMKMRSVSAGGEEDEEDEQDGAHVRTKEEPAAVTRPILSADAIQVHSLTGAAPLMPGTRLTPPRRSEDLMVSAFTSARRGRIERGFVVS